MDVGTVALDGRTDALTALLDRLGELHAGTRVTADAFFADAFMREHTRYDTFAAFRADAPVDVPRDGDATADARLNEFVRDATEFETWDAMETRAAEEELVDQHLLAEPA